MLVPEPVCPEGYKPLTSSWQDCRAAAISLGFSADSVAPMDYRYEWGEEDRPQGCFQSTGNYRFHFNTGPGGSIEASFQILCVRKGKELCITTCSRTSYDGNGLQLQSFTGHLEGGCSAGVLRDFDDVLKHPFRFVNLFLLLALSLICFLKISMYELEEKVQSCGISPPLY